MSQTSVRPAAPAALWFAAVAAVVAAAVWVVLTARSGVTYHLFPLVIAASVGFVSRLSGAPLRPLEAAAAIGGGVLAVAAGWLALVMLDETPTATFIADQPGGVPGETVIFALLGAALSLWWVTKRRER